MAQAGIIERARAALYAQLTFRNIAGGSALLVFFLFIGISVSWSFAFVVLVLCAMAGVALIEVSARRKWERFMTGHVQRMADDYERLVREVARARNDVSALRQQLVDTAGTLTRAYDGGKAGVSAEKHMALMIAEHLSKLGTQPPEAAAIADAPLLPAADMARLAATGETEVGRELSDAQVLQLVNAATREDRVDLFLQPVVALPQRKPRFYETSARIRVAKGVYLSPARHVEIAVKHDMMPVIDNLLLLRGLQLLRQAGTGDYNRAFFFNVSSLTLHDPKFMGDLVAFISQNRELAPLIVFEMSQRDIATLEAETLPVLEGLSRLGCRFSMDQVRNISFDYDYLEIHHVRFIKIEAVLLLAELATDGGLERLRRMKLNLDRSGIDMIVEKIETDRQLLELLDLDIDYGQGTLFGRPARQGENA